jgi:hypothetical protein
MRPATLQTAGPAAEKRRYDTRTVDKRRLLRLLLCSAQLCTAQNWDQRFEEVSVMNKDAMQMLDQMNAMGKTAFESLLRFNEIALHNIERVAQQQLAVVGDCFESGLNHFNAMSEVKGVQDVLLGQTRLATECNEKWVANARKCLEISLQAQTEFGQWLNDSAGALTAQPKQTVVQPKKPVEKAA